MLRAREHNQQIRDGFLGELLSGFVHPVSLTNRLNRFVFVNRAFEKFYGYDSEDVIGLTPWLLLPPQSSESQRTRFLQVLEEPTGCWEGKITNLKSDGTKLHVYLIAFPLVPPPLRKPALYLGISNDESRKDVLLRDFTRHFSVYCMQLHALSLPTRLHSKSFRKGDRMREIVRLTQMGYSTKEVAHFMDIAPNTVAQVKWRLSKRGS